MPILPKLHWHQSSAQKKHDELGRAPTKEEHPNVEASSSGYERS